MGRNDHTGKPWQCTAMSKRSRKRCKNAAIPGGKVCRDHGGRAPQVKAKAAEVMAEKTVLGRMGELMAEAGEQVDGLTEPEAYMAVLRKVRRTVAALDVMVGELEDPTISAFGGGLARHPLLDLHHRYLDLEGRMLKEAMALGLAVRVQAWKEGELASIGAAIRSLVTGLGHRMDDPLVVPVVEQALALIAGDEAA